VVDDRADHRRSSQVKMLHAAGSLTGARSFIAMTGRPSAPTRADNLFAFQILGRRQISPPFYPTQDR
jgi:hypothetical protein